MKWHWAHCPLCINGEIETRGFVMGGTGGTARESMFVERRPCECCDGSGRIKVPDGYHLTPDVVGISITSDHTTMLETK